MIIIPTTKGPVLISDEDFGLVMGLGDGGKADSGYCDTAEEAAQEYVRASIRLYGEFAFTNFPRTTYETQPIA